MIEGICPVCRVNQGSGLWDHMELCRIKWAKEHPECPWSWAHRPDEKVVISTTVIGNFTVELGRKAPARSEEKVIRYADWDGRCRVCCPR